MNKLYFESQEKAWKFMASVSGKLEILDYGFDGKRIINSYYVVLGGKL